MEPEVREPEVREPEGVEFRVLGSLEVLLGGRPVAVAGRRARVVLGLLLLHTGRAVPVDRLVDLVWHGQEPIRTAQNALQVSVSHLRSVLGAAAPIVYSGDAYRIDVPVEAVDAHRFRDVVERARLLAGAEKAAALRSAEALWRGPLLLGTLAAGARDHHFAGWEELRLAALEERVAAELDLGRHDQLSGELAELVRQHPIRERLTELQMRALWRNGRTADAVEAYRKLRHRLADELGIEPHLEVQALHAEILRGAESAEAARPAQLPPPITHFTGRSDQVGQLDRLMIRSAQHGTMVISAIKGMGGIGKTALAVHWGHRVASAFPDGQLYLNLRGYGTGSPMHPHEALSRLLRSVGVRPQDVPSDVDDASALFRSRLDGKKMLLLLDNAGSVEQVRPLLPNGREQFTLITSRAALTGLMIRDGALALTLDTLDRGDAVQLLSGVLGEARVAAEPDAVAELLALVGGLPLALRIAAAHLSEVPGESVWAYLAELKRTTRLDVLHVDGDPQTAVRAVFEASYLALDEAAQHFFTLLGMLPGAEFGIESAVALSDAGVAQTHRLLRTLVNAHLVRELPTSRFVLHDLVKDYACEKARAEADSGQAAFERLLVLYTAMAERAGDHAHYGRRTLYEPVADASPFAWEFGDRDEAFAWFRLEVANLVGSVQLAADRGLSAHAWQLAYHLRRALRAEHMIFEWLATHAIGLQAAERLGDTRIQAMIRISLGSAYGLRGQDDLALAEYQRAMELADETILPYVYGHIGNTVQHDDVESCMAYLRRAIASPVLQRDPRQIASNKMNLAVLHARQGELESAREVFLEVLDDAAELHDPELTCLLHQNIGFCSFELHDFALAMAHARQALEAAQRIGNRLHQGRAHRLVGDVHIAQSQREDGRRAWMEALRIFEELEDPRADKLREDLAA